MRITCRLAGGGSLARSAKLSDVPRPRMWSWKKTSTSLQKSCGRVGGIVRAAVPRRLGERCDSGARLDMPQSSLLVLN